MRRDCSLATRHRAACLGYSQRPTLSRTHSLIESHAAVAGVRAVAAHLRMRSAAAKVGDSGCSEAAWNSITALERCLVTAAIGEDGIEVGRLIRRRSGRRPGRCVSTLTTNPCAGIGISFWMIRIVRAGRNRPCRIRRPGRRPPRYRRHRLEPRREPGFRAPSGSRKIVWSIRSGWLNSCMMSTKTFLSWRSRSSLAASSTARLIDASS